MSPFGYYKAVFLGEKFKTEASFLPCFRMALQFAAHICRKDKAIDTENDKVLHALCLGAELLMPYTGNPYVTEEHFDSYALKVENSRLFGDLTAMFCVHLPEELLYRGVQGC